MITFARMSSRSLHGSLQQSRNIGHLSFSTAPTVAASIKPSPINQYQRIILPTKPTNKPLVENRVLKVAMQDLKKKREEINDLQWLMDRIKIDTLSPNVPTPPGSTPHHTFQVMNRNARKAKRANHGKRPCSRDRRRWKIKKWANTSRRG